ncbi:MAG TPA: ImmA/IrrE family metallo-endopeptidase [Blastocatellia bacterium]|nr:ImmA/IrrE family metallo-endopeptidase [Blastocatellia bacterium]
MSKALVPPTAKGRKYEQQARNIRAFAGLKRDDERLDPFALAPYAGLLVVDFSQIEGLSEQARNHLLGEGAKDWSGGTFTRPLPNGRQLVILNPKHGLQRHQATLMEEVCHVFLGHKANKLEVTKTNEQGKIVARDYHDEDEEEAYSVGAAALVPYAALHRFVTTGKTTFQIARHFGVSRQLVIYRIQISMLWPEYKKRHPAEVEEYQQKYYGQFGKPVKPTEDTEEAQRSATDAAS